MLRALLSGKAGVLKKAVLPGTPWLDAFRGNEDVLTATVFERLAYLDGPCLWGVLASVFPSLPTYQVAEVLTIEFWPRWSELESPGTVIPDVFLQFQVGDPAVIVSLIVEAKLDDLQYAGQWKREWDGFRARPKEYGGQPETVFLLAIGGHGASARSTVARLVAEINAISPNERRFQVCAENVWPS